MNDFERVGEFHTTYGQIKYEGGAPRKLSKEQLKLRLNLVWEEFTELIDACYGGDKTVIDVIRPEMEAIIEGACPSKLDLVETCDALGDMIYVINGFSHYLNVNMDEVVGEIHRSNMSKLDPETGKPIYREDGKVLKGSAYTPPDIKKVIYK